ncbi:spore cortex biosynthesis protein YabQ [[Clostridium] dakarense]|uniref:spore cortex biosynthesis protein YabQ n=1 Tax=Faecalimicrobium dakarense TaxID=1301100 RepID=UPI0005A6282B
MMPFTQDASSFYATIYGGIIIGVLFDIYRALKSNFKFMKYFSVVFDAIFWILATMVIFITVNAVESFELRYYHFAALFIGFILYYNTVSKFILSIINKIIYLITSFFIKTVKYIVSISNNLYYIIIYSIHFLFDMIFYIPNMILATKNVVKRKSKNKTKRKIKRKRV